MKRIIFLLVIFISFYGCEKEGSFEYSSGLIGEWSLFRSCGGIVGCTTPEITGIKMNLVFTTDSILNMYVNDTLLKSHKFKVDKITTTGRRGTLDILCYDSKCKIFSIYHDTLSLFYTNIDAYSYYKRIRQIHF
ncbi:MAG: hypothetical protein MUO72_01330 [Bacteroidales bacterium]|nr:hypothetical protein [Bacteroidales bacterium]